MLCEIRSFFIPNEGIYIIAHKSPGLKRIFPQFYISNKESRNHLLGRDKHSSDSEPIVFSVIGTA